MEEIMHKINTAFFLILSFVFIGGTGSIQSNAAGWIALFDGKTLNGW
jgi:hypothetical protein